MDNAIRKVWEEYIVRNGISQYYMEYIYDTTMYYYKKGEEYIVRNGKTSIIQKRKPGESIQA